MHDYPGERVLLVAHGVVAKVIRALTRASFDDFFEWQLYNGGRLVVKLDSAGSATDILQYHRPTGQDELRY